MKIIHIEDHLMFAQGLMLLAEQEWPDVDWIIVSTVKEAYELLENHHDVALVLLDLTLSDVNGISFLRQLRLNKLVFPVVLMTASIDLVEIKEALEEGAMGFIPKSYSGKQAIDAIKISLNGQPFIPTEYKWGLQRVGKRGGEKRQKLARAYSLTSKQMQVLELM
ncbi:MAG: response regulator transcription factor [Gammaproteobacteria bacterium]|nr:response regulator transcription factor [Gammaproteobacteria bacterium]